MVNILFDLKSSQVQVDYQTATRLTDMYSAILDSKPPQLVYSLAFSPIDSLITPDVLKPNNVFCILTRLHQLAPSTPKSGPYPPYSNPLPYYPVFPEDSFQYAPSEIVAIQQWVSEGNGLLLISDHGPMPGNVMDNQTINDCALAAAFGVGIQPAYFWNQNGGLIEMSSSTFCFNPAFQDSVLQSVSNIAIHDCGAIFPLVPNTNIQTIVWLPAGLENGSPINNFPKTKENEMAFAVYVSWGKGRVIIAGNSGIAGNTSHPYPAQDLFYDAAAAGPQKMPYGPPELLPYYPATKSYLPPANNQTFLMNCLAYVAGVQ